MQRRAKESSEQLTLNRAGILTAGDLPAKLYTYIMQHGDSVEPSLQLPETKGGRNIRFTLAQAQRLVHAGRLISCGIVLRDAARIVWRIEQTARSFSRGNDATPYYSPHRYLIVEIVSGQYWRLCLEAQMGKQLTHMEMMHWDEPSYTCAKTGHWIHPAGVRESALRASWNITELALDLEAMARGRWFEYIASPED